MNKARLLRSDGDNFKATYENYEVACPICKKWNVFNRITDIKSIGAACGKQVQCQYCKRDFIINADELEEQYEYFLNDCDVLMKEKKYMYCVLILCQACEAFFMKCIDIKLLWEPYRKGVFGWNDKKYQLFDDFFEQVHNEFRRSTYHSLRKIVLDIYLNNRSCSIQEEILNYLKMMTNSTYIREPSDETIRTEFDDRRRQVLLRLKRLKIHEIRNAVAHKEGFRPTLNDVKYHMAQVKSYIEDFKTVFNLHDILEYCSISNVMESLRKRHIEI
jgi:hypothetical protein